jgi:hypothetical protein
MSAGLVCNIGQQVNKLLARVTTMLEGMKDIWLTINTLKFAGTKAHHLHSL